MESYEIEKYKVAIKVSDNELADCNITIDDIMERKAESWEYLHSLKQFAVKSTEYDWPGCAFSMEIKVIPNEGAVFIFSETVKDFVKGLKSSQKIADHGSILLRELINHIEAADEESARKIIRDFEKSVREVN